MPDRTLVLALLTITAATAGLPAASADHMPNDIVRFQPVAEFEQVPAGAWINWTVIELPPLGEATGVPDGYELYRATASAGGMPTFTPDGIPVPGAPPSHDHVRVATLPYQQGLQAYSYLDTTFDARLASLYYVRAVKVEAGVESHGLPSNPVGTYPRCMWVVVGFDPTQLTFDFGCIIPVPGLPYPSCNPIEFDVIPFNPPRADLACLVPALPPV